ncbi:hypothetical protein GCM10010378_39720 [Streptomyces viridochromogenes]
MPNNRGLAERNSSRPLSDVSGWAPARMGRPFWPCALHATREGEGYALRAASAHAIAFARTGHTVAIAVRDPLDPPLAPAARPMLRKTVVDG